MLNKELIDRAWRVLPAEFKEEVKKEYKHQISIDNEQAYWMLERIFGKHNLTSDAEGEGMLTVPRKDVVELYQEVQKTISQCKGTELAIQAIGIKNVIWSFFGSKCLPDEAQPKQKDCDNPLADKEGCRWRNDGKCAFDSACYFEPLNPQEPNYEVGDKIRIVKGGVFYGRIGEVTDIDFIGSLVYYKTDRSYEWLKKSDLEPYKEPEESPRQFYRVMGTDEQGRQVVTPIPPQLAGPYDISKERTEPEESTCTETCTDDCSSQCKSQDFDNILKDSFSKERRLNIAAMAMQGILSAPLDNVGFVIDKTVNGVAVYAVRCADALIAELNKKKDGR